MIRENIGEIVTSIILSFVQKWKVSNFIQQDILKKLFVEKFKSGNAKRHFFTKDYYFLRLQTFQKEGQKIFQILLHARKKSTYLYNNFYVAISIVNEMTLNSTFQNPLTTDLDSGNFSAELRVQIWKRQAQVKYKKEDLK